MNLDIPRLRMFAGPNGSGKSTIGKAILSLLDETEGKVSFEKENLVGLDKKALSPYRRKIQVVFQDPFSSLSPRLTIEQIIAEGMKVHNIGGNTVERREIVAKTLEEVGLTADMMYRFPHEFSGGQRQRIAIARALALMPQFIVSDEPVSALDVSIQAEILNLLNDLKEEFHLTYIFISHDLSVINYFCNKLNSRICFFSTISIIFFQP